MKKQITIRICDICEKEHAIDDKLEHCELCNKEVCEDCSTQYQLMGDFLPDIIICDNCFKDKEGTIEFKRFFKQPKVKELLLKIRKELKEHLIKLAMVNSLK